MKKYFLIFLCFSLISLYGCGGTSKIYREVLKEEPNYNLRQYAATSEELFPVLLKVFLSKNFLIDTEDPEKGMIVAKRYLQKGKRNIIIALQAKMIPQDENQTLVYINAIQTTERTYVADRTRFFLFIVPLPGGGGKEATKVKENEVAITDKEFYDDFFNRIQSEISPDHPDGTKI